MEGVGGISKDRGMARQPLGQGPGGEKPPSPAAAQGGACGPGEVQGRGRRLRDFGDPREEKRGGWLQAFHCQGKEEEGWFVGAGWAGKVRAAGDLSCKKQWGHKRGR